MYFIVFVLIEPPFEKQMFFCGHSWFGLPQVGTVLIFYIEKHELSYFLY